MDDNRWQYQKSEYKRDKNPNWKGGKEVPCVHCGKLIYRKPWELKRNKNQFCSKECHDEFRRKPKETISISEMRGEKHGRWSGARFCKICGKELIERHERRLGRCESEYCKNEVKKFCVHRLSDHPSWKGGKVFVNCRQCGKEFLVTPAKVETTYYCSVECRGIARRTRVILACEHCGNEFIVAAARYKDLNPRFCSLHCYRSFSGKTTPEIKVAVTLDDIGLEYINEYRPKGTRSIFDFFIPDLNLLIEVDGDFWHYSEWAKQNGTPKKDAAKSEWAIENGYRLIRIRESEMDGVDLMPFLKKEIEI